MEKGARMIDVENICIKCGKPFKARACIDQLNNPDQAWIVECRLCCGFVFGPTAEKAEQIYRDGQKWGTDLIRTLQGKVEILEAQIKLMKYETMIEKRKATLKKLGKKKNG
jgi:hypothetical protein